MMTHLLPFAILLHALDEGGGDISLPGPGDVWSAHHWTWEWSITVPLAAIAAWYLIGSARRRSRYPALKWRHLAFWGGWLTLVFALVSPLHQLGDALFSAHMFQHELLILLAAPLIAAAHPSVTLLYALSPKYRAHVGRFISSAERHPIVSFVTAPLSAFLLHAVALWGWHIPALYEATISSDFIHALQHLSFFVSGLVFWSALYGAGRSSMGYGSAVLYTFGTAVHCSALGALLTFSNVLWYPIYANRTEIWHMSALQDQQLGGLLMWVPSGVIFIVIGLVLTGRWMTASTERARHTSLHPVKEMQ